MTKRIVKNDIHIAEKNDFKRIKTSFETKSQVEDQKVLSDKLLKPRSFSKNYICSRRDSNTPNDNNGNLVYNTKSPSNMIDPSIRMKQMALNEEFKRKFGIKWNEKFFITSVLFHITKIW